MRIEKKRILKADGRYLVYYHFPETATQEESATYAEIQQAGAEAGKSPTTTTTSEEQPRV